MIQLVEFILVFDSIPIIYILIYYFIFHLYAFIVFICFNFVI